MQLVELAGLRHKVNLATVHSYYGKGSAEMQRHTEEIAQLTSLLAQRAKNDNDSNADAYLIALRDFMWGIQCLIGPVPGSAGVLICLREVPPPFCKQDVARLRVAVE